jgi:hypothetical protein
MPIPKSANLLPELHLLGQDVILRYRVRTDAAPIAPTDVGETETGALDFLEKPRLFAGDAFFRVFRIESQTGTYLVTEVENRRPIAYGGCGSEVEQEHADEG